MRTPAGSGFGLDILLTGRFREAGAKITAVEISMPIEIDYVRGYTVEPLEKTPSGRPLWWADPGDLCADDGSTLNREELRAEIDRVRKARDEDMRRGPLGENWP